MNFTVTVNDTTLRDGLLLPSGDADGRPAI